MNEVHEEPVFPRSIGWTRLDAGEVGSPQAEFGERQRQCPRTMEGLERHARLIGISWYVGLARFEDDEPCRVVKFVNNIGEKDLETVRSGGLRRRQRGAGWITSLGDHANRSGRVIDWDGLPSPTSNGAAGLRKGLRMRPNADDLVEARTGNTEDRVSHLDVMFGDNLGPTGHELIENRKDTAGS